MPKPKLRTSEQLLLTTNSCQTGNPSWNSIPEEGFVSRQTKLDMLSDHLLRHNKCSLDVKWF